MDTKMNRTIRFNKRTIENLPNTPKSNKSNEVEYTDSDCRALKLCVAKNGRRYFIHRYRVKRGRRTIRRCLRLGEFPSLTVSDARAIVNENARNLAMFNIDPQEEKSTRENQLTFSEFFEKKYMEDHAKLYKKSWKDDLNKYNLHLKKEFGNSLISDIKKHDIIHFINRIKKQTSGPSANRYLSLISKVFTCALDWEFIKEGNPCSGIKKFKEGDGRTRFLLPEEVKRLKAALDASPQRISALLIWFLLCSGCRLGEASGLKWEDVDQEKCIAILGSDRSKSGYSRPIILNRQAMETLKELEQHRIPGNPYVCPGRGSSAGHLTSPRKTFAKVCEMAELDDLRIHDLRHAHASFLASGDHNVSLYMISKLLGHRTVAMSSRYSHLFSDKMHEASESVSTQLEQAIK